MEKDSVKIKIFRLLLSIAVSSMVLSVVACSLAGEPTKYITTTLTQTQDAPITVTKTITSTYTSQPKTSTVTTTHYVDNETTVTVSGVTTAPPVTVFVTTTVVQSGIIVTQINLPSAEIPTANLFNITIVVQNVSAQDMDCNLPVIIKGMRDTDYETELHIEFFIESGETKKVITSFLQLSVGIYKVSAGGEERELTILEGGG